MSDQHLILGGCGFIGRHVAVLLARAGYRVILASRNPPPFTFPADTFGSITWQSMELGSADWDTLVAEADVIHHYAWTSIPASANANAVGDLTTNVIATLAMLEAVRRRGAGRVLFASSGGTVYGRLQCVPAPEDHPLAPITGYAAGKVTAEVYLGLYRELYGLDCRVARIANPYGPGQNSARGQGAVTAFLRNALAERPIVVWGTGDVVRDYVHVVDVAAALVTLAVTPCVESFWTFNVGSGSGLSLNSVLTELERYLGRPLNVKRVQARRFDVPVSVLDITRARDTLGWAPRLSFSVGLARTVADLARNCSISSM
jgi:UDP-glucose 4-epimerase